MKKKFYLSIKIFSSIFLLFFPTQWAQSCGPLFLPDEGRFCVFHQELGQSSAWIPFFYTQYERNSNTPDPNGLDKKRNVQEWANEVKSGVKPADIYEVLYQTSPDDFLYMANTQNWEDLADNSFVKWLRQPANHLYFEYVKAAKENEFHQFKSDSDPWGSKNSAKSDAQIFKHLTHITEPLNHPEVAKTFPKFLQQRYAFLQIRSSQGVIGGNYPMQELFDKYLRNQNTILEDWAYIHLGLEAIEDDTLKGTELLIKAFDRSEEKKLRAMMRLKDNYLDNFCQKSNDNHLKAVAKVIKILDNPGQCLNEWEKIYELEPDCKYFPLLIQREINKLEDWLLSPEVININVLTQERVPDTFYMCSFNDANAILKKNKLKDLDYLQKVKNFLTTHASRNYLTNIHQKLALAHLQIMEGNYQAAKETLNQLPENLAPQWAIQRNIERVLTIAQTEEMSAAATQAKLYALLSALQKNYPKKKRAELSEYDESEVSNGVENADDLDELYLYLSRVYEEKGEKVIAGLLYQKARIFKNEYDGFEYGYEPDNSYYPTISFWDKHASSDEVGELLVFKAKKNKTLFEQFISPKKWGSDDIYRELQGTLAFREGNLKASEAAFAALPADYWEKNYAFKEYFSVRHASYNYLMPTEDKDDYPARGNSKHKVVQEIVALIDSAEQAKDLNLTAEYYYRLGNAYFNCTYHGVNWMVYSYGQTDQEWENSTTSNSIYWHFDFYPATAKYGDDYYGCAKAREYFLKSIEVNAPSQEAAAKSTFMLHYCEPLKQDWELAKSGNLQPYNWYEEEENPKKEQDIYLKTFHQKYQNTKAYDILTSTCPDT